MDYLVWNPDPILISFLGLSIHWYGVIFASAILSGYHILKWVYDRENKDVESLDTLFLYSFIGIVVGARLAHCLFYDPEFYLANPMKILAVWEGGLASHGGGLGVIIASYFYAKKYKINLLWLLDRFSLATAAFAFFVRIGNFINSEIVGIQTDVSWAVIFEKLDTIPRHPAQLYEATLYFIIFFILLAVYMYRKTNKNGYLFGLFLILVFSARFIVEFVKVKQASYASDFLISTGQMLSIPFLLIGIALIIYSSKK